MSELQRRIPVEMEFGAGDQGLTLVLLDTAVEDVHGKKPGFLGETFYEGKEEYLFCRAGS